MPMEKKSFSRKVSGTVELCLCFACRSIWFDKYESLQLEPASVIELFTLINEHGDDQRQPLTDKLPCPYCGDTLMPSKIMPPDAKLLADALIDKQRKPGLGRECKDIHGGIGDRLIDGVVMAWHLLRNE
jgi:hypothetical protein